MATEITSRDELSFTLRDASGERHHWHLSELAPDRAPGECLRRGGALFEEVAALARVDEYEAYLALVGAVLSEAWDVGRGEEHGFAEALASAALVGLRARDARDTLPFARTFVPAQAQRLAMYTRIELMEAQLHALKQTPWRTWPAAVAEA